MSSGASWGSSRTGKCARARTSQTNHPQSQEDYLFGVRLVMLLVLSPLLAPSACARAHAHTHTHTLSKTEA